MKYIYLDPQGDPVGPVDESAVVQAIREGVLKADSPIRNALLREFYTVADFDCFAEVLAEAAPAPDGKTSASEALSWWRYLAQIARDQVESEESSAIAGKLVPGDAAVSRRLLAMLLDVLVLAVAILPLFLPTLAGMKDLGERDEEELARRGIAQQKYQDAVKKPGKQSRNTASRKSGQDAARAETAPAADAPAAEPQHDTRRALVNRVAPNALRKLDNAYATHNAAVRQAGREGNAPKPRQKASSRRRVKPSAPSMTNPAAPQKADAAATPESPAPQTAETPADKPAIPMPKLADPPRVVLTNMPGGARFAKALPSAAQKMEYAAIPEKSGWFGDLLILGCSREGGVLRLRTGGDVRKIPYPEFRAHVAAPVKWAVLVVLLYYTLAFSIFAQTVGMWFWGIFLTRSRVAEVLPFRAVLYTACMLVFGILMIPMVLITKRSLADWICGVRQIGVGSVSKS